MRDNMQMLLMRYAIIMRYCKPAIVELISTEFNTEIAMCNVTSMCLKTYYISKDWFIIHFSSRTSGFSPSQKMNL